MELPQEQCLILFFSFIATQFILAIRGKLFSPINIIVCYWYLWLFLSTQGIGGLLIPSNQLYSLHCTFLGAFVIGSCLVKAITKNSHDGYWLARDTKLSENVNNKLFAIFFLFIPPTFYFFAKSISLILSGYIGLRGDLVGMEHNPIFSSVLINYFYYVIMKGLWLFYCPFACATFIKNKSKKHILMVFLYAFILSGIYFSRTYMYIFFIMLVWAYLIKVMSQKHKSLLDLTDLRKKFFGNKVFFKSMFILSLLIIGIAVQSKLREKSVGGQSKNILIDTLIKYHTAGFVLFDLDLQKDSSPIYAKQTYGLGLFGGVEQFLGLFIKRINPEFAPIVAREELSIFFKVGIDEYGRNIRSNALYNIVYTLTRDCYYPAVILGGLLIGGLCNKTYILMINSQSLQHHSSSIFIFTFMITSLIRSNLESTSYWIPIFLFLLIFRHKHKCIVSFKTASH
tara:strand:- start:191 stop:1552 length:1362 start_codon:yes stop_codon:yes gene_type:complete